MYTKMYTNCPENDTFGAFYAQIGVLTRVQIKPRP